jgi:hypothetical protein
MTSNYSEIRSENKKRYGTDIARIGKMLLAERYSDRTHFIFELLQNAEDAFARRTNWQGDRCVDFCLSSKDLQIKHWGDRFDEKDVRSICGIAESGKALNAIGRFGIGFKSVYVFTNNPEVHSGSEDFAIESYVWPSAVPPLKERPKDATTLILPLDMGDPGAFDEVAIGLKKLGPRTLLFLTQINEINWTVESGASGIYLRDDPVVLGENVRQVTLIGEEKGKECIEETWLIFSRDLKSPEGSKGEVQIAFSLVHDKEDDRWAVHPVNESQLVVFFPTAIPTNLGFLVQGPYQTTPSRDNVPRENDWNTHLVKETAALTVEAMRWLRDNEHFDYGTKVLECLPLDCNRFGEDSIFAPLFQTVLESLKTEELLPCSNGMYASAIKTRIARSQELRDIFDRRQLGELQQYEGGLNWLTGDITPDRTPALNKYLRSEVGVQEIAPSSVLRKLDRDFLEAQSDDWIIRLYKFLDGQRSSADQIKRIPLVRLEDGTHVVAFLDERPQAFLPSDVETGFPTVRKSIYEIDSVRKYLEASGLTKPDLVDDVVHNVLSKYSGEHFQPSDDEYLSDIQRILKSSETDSKKKRNKLVQELKKSQVVMAVDAGDETRCMRAPSEVYIPTRRLKALFEGVSGVLFVDDSHSCLVGEPIRELLKACGASNSLEPQKLEGANLLSHEEKRKLRVAVDQRSLTKDITVVDYELRGLENLLATIKALPNEAAAGRSVLLWEALSDFVTSHGVGTFSGIYRWFYSKERGCTFSASFVHLLRDSAWVVDSCGERFAPISVVFSRLGWKPDNTLLAQIKFKSSSLDTFEKEEGLESGLIEFLRKHGLTTLEPLQSMLKTKEEAEAEATGLVRETFLPEPEPEPESGAVFLAKPRTESERPDNDLQGDSNPGLHQGAKSSGASGKSRKRTPGSAGGRPFISYVATHPDSEPSDPDNLDAKVRMALEKSAIEFIIHEEPKLQRTPTNNPGFDLYGIGEDGQKNRWVEVKSMSGTLQERPVALSHIQFEYARLKQDAYWLYVVEQAGNPKAARVIRIQNPAGKAGHFTFDKGWIEVAEIDDA